jgi:single-strand DNA-binding protein
MNSFHLTMQLLYAPESRMTRDNEREMGVVAGVLEMRKSEESPPTYQNINVTVWRDVERFLALNKGDLITFVGSMRLDTVDKGTYKAKVPTLNCSDFQIISQGDRPSAPKAPRVDLSNRNDSPQSTPVRSIAPTSPTTPQATASSDVPDYDDIPF